MTGSIAGPGLAAWTVPQCPFTIEYSPRVLDEIRLGVTDAFYSVPHGGAEIGGILLGFWRVGRLTIGGYAALYCEHATGPSFTLSPRDEARLAHLIDAHSGAEARPVGWFHSHTRSEICLSDTDIAIHRRYFPEPWQVALVLRPHTSQPMRAGFFFRETDGRFRTESCYREIVLHPLRVAAAAAAAEAGGVGGSAGARVWQPRFEAAPQEAAAAAQLPERQAKEAAPVPRPKDHTPPAEKPEPDVPEFLSPAPRQPLRFVRALLPLAAVFAAATGGYLTRDAWMPQAMARVHAASAPVPSGLGLHTADRGGQFEIRWDPAAPAIRRAAQAVLTIDSGAAGSQEVVLDRPHLESGVFTFGRQSERVDVTLTAAPPGSQPVREATAFLGKPSADAGGDLADRIAQLRANLDAETESNRKLRWWVEQLLKEVRDRQPRTGSASTAQPSPEKR